VEEVAPPRDGCVQSLVRALGLLDQLASHEGGLTLTEVARMAELPRSTAHRLLTTMEAMRYVAFDPHTNQWLIGARALAFGASSVEGADIGRVARPILHSLLLNTRMTASLALPQGGGVRCAGQSRAPSDRATPVRPGDYLAYHISAAGKAILATWSEERLRTWLAGAVLAPRTAFSITDPDALLADLQEVRRRGYAVSDQETADGLRAVAAAVRGPDGEARAALAVSGPLLRLPDARLPAVGTNLVFAAKRMSEGCRDAVAA
jgi:IclR family acetate operon transcriptional repressor